MVPKTLAMIEDTKGTVESGNSKSSCDHFFASAYLKNCKTNNNINKWANVMFFFRKWVVTSYMVFTD